MDYIISNGWNIETGIFTGENPDEYVKKISEVSSRNNMHGSRNVKLKFRHKFHGVKYFPLLHDSINNVDYLSLGFVYDSYGHLGFNRIEVRNRKAYIFIADKNYFSDKEGNVRVRIFNTCSIKHILAASVHMEDKIKFLMNYDDNNIYYDRIIPEDCAFIIDAEISRVTESFMETISFGKEVIKRTMVYNRLKIFRFSFNEKRCCGIIQGGDDHLFLYKVAVKLGTDVGKV
ncbi:MAG: hypothetical protein RE471_04645 [Ferroplasma sp.]|uniref:hypothetical protein n=1 Tax=Ferroplasma sp. TaxID=2591003 RepID=UPI002814B569|nr:hypothetical protein [Ferroplasma sp.]WMT52170.1 MAG: hypothetical protein RE471_04645 [Ferroplasma sp.]